MWHFLNGFITCTTRRSAYAVPGAFDSSSDEGTTIPAPSIEIQNLLKRMKVRIFILNVIYFLYDMKWPKICKI